MKNMYTSLFPALRHVAVGLAMGLVIITARAQKPITHSESVVDRIIAVVNNEAITQRALNASIEQTIHRLRQQGTALPEAAQLRAYALEQMVLKYIQLQQARATQIHIRDVELTAALERLAQDRGLSIEAYRAQLERQGLSWSTLKQDVENELLLARLREKEIDRQIVVSDAEVTDYLVHAVEPEIVQTHARHILLHVNDQVSEAQVRRQLLGVKRKVEAGGDFADFARQFSVDGTAPQGGDLGWLNPGQTVPEFERVMDSLKEGEISAPVRSAYGMHLIQVLERRRAELSMQQKQNLARQTIGVRKAARAYADWLRALRDRASVRYMTLEFS